MIISLFSLINFSEFSVIVLASSSNLNHDVGIDTKSEYSCASHTVNDGWAPLLPIEDHTDSERYSRYV